MTNIREESKTLRIFLIQIKKLSQKNYMIDTLFFFHIRKPKIVKNICF